MSGLGEASVFGVREGKRKGEDFGTARNAKSAKNLKKVRMNFLYVFFEFSAV